MDTKKIEHYAKKFNKALIMGLASTAMLGMLTGCRKSPKYANLNTDLTHREVFQSHSLNSLISNNFDDTIASDIMRSDGRATIFSPAMSDSKRSEGKIKFDTISSKLNDYSDSYYSYSSDGSDDVSDSDAKVSKVANLSDTASDDETHNRSEEPPVYYRINKKKASLFIFVPHSFGSLKAIQYKLNSEDTHLLGGKTYIFKPTRVWHNLNYHRNGYHVPSHIAKRNMLKLKHTGNLKSYKHKKTLLDKILN